MELILVSIIIRPHPVIDTNLESNTNNILNRVFELLILFDFRLYFFDNFFNLTII